MHRIATLDPFLNVTVDRLLILVGLLDVAPGLLAQVLQIRQPGLAATIIKQFDLDHDVIAFLDADRPVSGPKLINGYLAVGLEAGGDMDPVAVNLAHQHLNRGTFAYLAAVFELGEQGGKGFLLARGFADNCGDVLLHEM